MFLVWHFDLASPESVNRFAEQTCFCFVFYALRSFFCIYRLYTKSCTIEGNSINSFITTQNQTKSSTKPPSKTPFGTTCARESWNCQAEICIHPLRRWRGNATAILWMKKIFGGTNCSTVQTKTTWVVTKRRPKEWGGEGRGKSLRVSADVVSFRNCNMVPWSWKRLLTF